ncbi:MobQ family relaxase [Congzhengia minquanensis]|uniref:MobQ family relaxase n=1 Tax=Congzhengia minquanensis TaxID=2763657 RepID=UPI002016231C|nr:MobQ family relaxase [Congzhengia minquanensis]
MREPYTATTAVSIEEVNNLSLYHFHVFQIKRSKGQSAIAAAAYRAGEKLHSNYYGEDADYTKKGGVICSEILLPPHAPKEFADRETLWNAVEKIEQHPKAQLAYSFDIALQNEFSMEENIDLARQFLLDEFVSRGMTVDFAVHSPDKEDGGIANPHFHFLCPIRPINSDSTWGTKQRREYVLDENGNRVRDDAGHYVFNAVPTTDWGRPETLEHWRQAWAELCNAKFAEKNLDCRIDHRSYEQQGLDIVPTIHEGPAVREMEAKGILTDKGELNRWIRRINSMRKNIVSMLSELFAAIREINRELKAPKEPTLTKLITDYYSGRNAGAWSVYAKVGNLKNMSQLVNYVRENNLRTVADLEARVSDQQEKLDARSASCKSVEAKIKEISELLRQAQNYADTKPVYDEWYRIKFKGKKDKFKGEHES